MGQALAGESGATQRCLAVALAECVALAKVPEDAELVAGLGRQIYPILREMGGKDIALAAP